MTLPTKTIRQIEASLAHAVGENEPGIAVGIAQGGRMVWGGARGLANLKSQEVFSTKTPFRICSISKQFSCALVMREVATGRIDLTAHPSRYVPWTKVLDRDLTIAHLMQNKSGLRDQWVMAMMMGARAEQRFTLADGVTAVKHAPASMWTPGSQNLYCNANFELLGEVLQRVTGESVGALLQKHIFVPLMMRDTTLGIDTAEPIAGDARGYRFIDGAWQEEENAIHWGASAGIVSTIEDLLKWAACLRDPSAAGLPWVGDITRASPFNDGNPATYACGINHAINALGNPKREMLAHAGALRGWRSTLMHFVAEDTSIGVFMNRTNSPKGKLVRGVANEILEALKIAPIWRRGRTKPTTAKLPRGAAGAYVSREQGLLIQLREDGGEAQVFSHLDWSALCRSERADTLATDDGHLTLHFGQPSQLTLRMREENVHAVMQHIKPARPAHGPFKSGGRFHCAPIKSSAEVFVNNQGAAEIAFTGIFGEGVRYPLTVVNEGVAWFDLSRGVDESPPGRVLVVFDPTENKIEVSCMLARRIVFRSVA
jgi:D-aminopeptidase